MKKQGWFYEIECWKKRKKSRACAKKVRPFSKNIRLFFNKALLFSDKAKCGINCSFYFTNCVCQNFSHFLQSRPTLKSKILATHFATNSDSPSTPFVRKSTYNFYSKSPFYAHILARCAPFCAFFALNSCLSKYKDIFLQTENK